MTITKLTLQIETSDSTFATIGQAIESEARKDAQAIHDLGYCCRIVTESGVVVAEYFPNPH